MQIEAQVSNVAYGGSGIARVDGKVYFVPDVVPGDSIVAEVITDNGRYADAKLLQITEPSPLRQASPCPYSSRCGGCQWQGIPYSEQLKWKQGFVAQALKRIGRLADDTPPRIIASPSPLGYRSRILVRLYVSASGVISLGYFARGTHELIEVTACAIAGPRINKVLELIRAMHGQGFEGLKVRLEIQELLSQTNEVLITVYPGDGPSPEVEGLAARLAALPGVAWAGTVFALRTAPMFCYESDLEREYYTLPGQFQQVNAALNRILRQNIYNIVSGKGASRVLDVHCGAGNLSLALANGHRYVEGIESNPRAIAAARHALQANQLSQAVYLTGDAEAHLWKCARGGEKFDLVILDPPRQGMYPGMIPLRKIAPATIIYVSCDPTTLARDLAALCKGGFYEIEDLYCLDFFPNTFHVETVAVLSRGHT